MTWQSVRFLYLLGSSSSHRRQQSSDNKLEITIYIKGFGNKKFTHAQVTMTVEPFSAAHVSPRKPFAERTGGDTTTRAEKEGNCDNNLFA